MPDPIYFIGPSMLMDDFLLQLQVKFPPGKFICITSSNRFNFFDIAATAVAPVPQASVIPEPLSHTLTIYLFSFL